MNVFCLTDILNTDTRPDDIVPIASAKSYFQTCVNAREGNAKIIINTPFIRTLDVYV